MELVRVAPGGIQPCQVMLDTPTSFVILWCEKASHAYLWHVMLWTLSCMHARRQTSSVCVSHPHRNTLCPNIEGDTGCRVCLQKIEGLSLRKVHNDINWPTTSGYYPNEAHWPARLQKMMLQHAVRLVFSYRDKWTVEDGLVMKCHKTVITQSLHRK